MLGKRELMEIERLACLQTLKPALSHVIRLPSIKLTFHITSMCGFGYDEDE